jgi:NAD dependent epimerase/dehydratase family enzyme
MNVLVSGATGFIGSALVLELERLGHRVIRLSRSKPSAEDTIRWDPASGVLDPSRLGGLDAVAHLAAESVGEGRWT